MVEIDILNFYKFAAQLNLNPFRLTPYEQWIAFVRPDALLLGYDGGNQYLDPNINYPVLLEEAFDVWLGATYSI